MASCVEKVRDWPATLPLRVGPRGAGASVGTVMTGDARDVAGAIEVVGVVGVVGAAEVADADDIGDCNGGVQPVIAAIAMTTAVAALQRTAH